MGQDITGEFRNLINHHQNRNKILLRPIRRSSRTLKLAIQIDKQILSLAHFLHSLQEESYGSRPDSNGEETRRKLNDLVVSKLNEISNDISCAKKQLDESIGDNNEQTIRHREEILSSLQTRVTSLASIFEKIQKEAAKRLNLIEEFSPSNHYGGGGAGGSIGGEKIFLSSLPVEEEFGGVSFTEEERDNFMQEAVQEKEKAAIHAQNTQQIERQLHELAQLHGVMSQQIEEQAQEIDIIRQNTRESKVSIETGNENIEEVAKDSMSHRMMFSHLLMILSIFLLFFHYLAI